MYVCGKTEELSLLAIQCIVEVANKLKNVKCGRKPLFDVILYKAPTIIWCLILLLCETKLLTFSSEIRERCFCHTITCKTAVGL